MIARPLRQLVPASVLFGRWIAVLVCYLDDSGKDPQNPITTLAGYIAKESGWAAYEAQVERWFSEYGVNILHAKELHDTDGDFNGWPRLKKQSFVSRICLARAPHLMMGLSMSAAKGTYQLHKSERRPRHTVSPYGFCFNNIIDWIFRDIRIGPLSNVEGVALILECGHENNAEAEKEFCAIKEQHPDIANLLKSITFVSKGSCRAIQLADLLAFYSRRDSVAQFEAYQQQRESYEIDIMIKILTENLPHRGFVATDFGPDSGSRFFAGDL
jgi:hypothetical protein